MTVQYVGDTLYLPPLEREVNHIIVYNDGLNGFEHFEPERAGDDYKQAAEYWQRMYEQSFTEQTCRNVGYYIDGTRFKCSECGYNGWTKWAKDGEDKLPNYCPNCGAKVVR